MVALTRTVLSQPAVAKFAMGWAGGLPDTKELGGAAGDQETAVHPTLCASTCMRTSWGRRQTINAGHFNRVCMLY